MLDEKKTIALGRQCQKTWCLIKMKSKREKRERERERERERLGFFFCVCSHIGVEVQVG